eukprot:g1757.t1
MPHLSRLVSSISRPSHIPFPCPASPTGHPAATFLPRPITNNSHLPSSISLAYRNAFFTASFSSRPSANNRAISFSSYSITSLSSRLLSFLLLLVFVVLTATPASAFDYTQNNNAIYLNAQQDAQEEVKSGLVHTNRSVLYLPAEPGKSYLTALRFTVPAPPPYQFAAGAVPVLQYAHLRFVRHPETPSEHAVNLTIKAERVMSSDSLFPSQDRQLSRKSWTSAVLWEVPSWGSVSVGTWDAALTSPDLSSLLQQVISLNGFSLPANFTLLLSAGGGGGSRLAFGSAGLANLAPQLLLGWRTQFKWELYPSLKSDGSQILDTQYQWYPHTNWLLNGPWHRYYVNYPSDLIENFYLQETVLVRPDPTSPYQKFGAQFTGWFLPQHTGNYTFYFDHRSRFLIKIGEGLNDLGSLLDWSITFSTQSSFTLTNLRFQNPKQTSTPVWLVAGVYYGILLRLQMDESYSSNRFSGFWLGATVVQGESRLGQLCLGAAPLCAEQGYCAYCSTMEGGGPDGLDGLCCEENLPGNGCEDSLGQTNDHVCVSRWDPQPLSGAHFFANSSFTAPALYYKDGGKNRGCGVEDSLVLYKDRPCQVTEADVLISCQYICDQHPDCQGFTYVSKGSPYSASTCNQTSLGPGACYFRSRAGSAELATAINHTCYWKWKPTETCDNFPSLCSGEKANCVNNSQSGVFQCLCDKGFDGPGCTDLNECEMGSHDCSEYALCTNLQGSYTCACNNGFNGDGRQCTPQLSQTALALLLILILVLVLWLIREYMGYKSRKYRQELEREARRHKSYAHNDSNHSSHSILPLPDLATGSSPPSRSASNRQLSGVAIPPASRVNSFLGSQDSSARSTKSFANPLSKHLFKTSRGSLGLSLIFTNSFPAEHEANVVNGCPSPDVALSPSPSFTLTATPPAAQTLVPADSQGRGPSSVSSASMLSGAVPSSVSSASISSGAVPSCSCPNTQTTCTCGAAVNSSTSNINGSVSNMSETGSPTDGNVDAPFGNLPTREESQGYASRMKEVPLVQPPLLHNRSQSTNIDLIAYEGSVKRAKRYPLLDFIAKQHSGNFISALLRTPITELCELLPLIGRLVSLPPPWLQGDSGKARDAVTLRAQQSSLVAQSIAILQATNIVPDNVSFQLNKRTHDCLDFFSILSNRSSELEKGTEFQVEDLLGATVAHKVIHPTDYSTEEELEVKVVRVRAIFASKTKPALLELMRDHKTPMPQKIIFKMGDDVRQDMLCLQIFRMFNHWWALEKISYRNCPVQVHTYGCLALTEEMGILEFVPGCKPVSEIESLNLYGEGLNTLGGTAAGAYMAVLCLGIRDRHYENILVRKDGLLFHIDFGFVLGQKPSVDTAAIAVIPEIPQLMGQTRWKEFVEVTVLAFSVLRRHSDDLIDLTQRLFSSFMGDAAKVRDFMSDTLMLNKSEEEAIAAMRKKVEAAPKKTATMVKNISHRIAITLKSAKENAVKKRDTSKSKKAESKPTVATASKIHHSPSRSTSKPGVPASQTNPAALQTDLTLLPQEVPSLNASMRSLDVSLRTPDKEPTTPTVDDLQTFPPVVEAEQEEFPPTSPSLSMGEDDSNRLVSVRVTPKGLHAIHTVSLSRASRIPPRAKCPPRPPPTAACPPRHTLTTTGAHPHKPTSPRPHTRARPSPITQGRCTILNLTSSPLPPLPATSSSLPLLLLQKKGTKQCPKPCKAGGRRHDAHHHST